MKMWLETQLKPPAVVHEAKEAKKGWHWAVEILAFIALFFICTLGEFLVLFPVQAVLLIGNSDFKKAVESGNTNLIFQAASSATGTDTFAIFSLFATAAMIIAVLLFARLVQKRQLSSFGFTKENSGKEYLKGALIGLAMFSSAVLLCVLTGSLKLSFDGETFVLSSFLLFTAGYMVQGMAEEVLCRGYFMVSLGRRYPMAAAVVLNSVAFAALHLFNPGIGILPMVNLILFGIFASICFIKTENIWLIGGAHSAWNLVQGNVYGIKVSGNQTSCSIFTSSMTEGKNLLHGGAFGLEGGLAVTIVLAAATAVLFLLKNKNDGAVGQL